MTVCMGISPNELMMPVLLSDTRVTCDGVDDWEDSPGRNRLRGGVRYLARKSHIINDKSILAFAGDVQSIADFLSYADVAIGTDESGRPLKSLAERAGVYPKGGVNVLGYYPRQTVDGSFELHHVKPDSVGISDIVRLGKIMAVGTGAEETLQQIEQLVKTIVVYNDINENKEFIDYHRFAVDNLNCCVMKEEIYSGDRLTTNRKTWGNFIEYAYLDPGEIAWKRQPKTVYLFYQLTCDEVGRAVSGPDMIDRVYLYDPGVEDGYLLAVNSSIKRGIYENLYVFRSLFSNGEIRTMNWLNWKPQQICLTFIKYIPDSHGGTSSIYYMGSYPCDDYNNITLVPRGGNLTHWTISPFGEKYEALCSYARRCQ